MSGAVPPPAARPLGRAAGVPRPVCPGCGRCRRGDPATAPQRAPLRAGVARYGGGGRASSGGVPSAVVRGVCGQALPLPRLPALWAGCWGQPPTCRGRGCVGVGAQHCPLGLHALWALRPAGVVGGRPRGGWPATVVRGVWCQALSLPWPPVLWGGRPGFCDPCVPGAVGVGVGTQHRPNGARPCGPALRAVGVAEGRPRGGCRSPLLGASGVRRSPFPSCPPSGRAVGVRYPGAVGAGVQAWGPCTGPMARVPCGGLRATGVAGGVWVQAPPLPCCLSSGQAAGARWPRAAGAGFGVCGACGACAVQAVVLGVALRLSLWCPPLWCFVAVLCSPCACRAPFTASVPCSSAGYLPFLSWLRRSLPLPLPSVGSPSSLACAFFLPPPWCVSRSFPLPASLAPVLGPFSFSPVGSCETDGGLGRVGLLGN